MLQIRDPHEILFWACNLLQELIVDAWAQVENSCLNWVCLHQAHLRADVYRGVKNAVTRDASGSGGAIDLDNVGKGVILPSPFIGGQCHMAQCYQDAMALARYFGKIDYFIAMTANPNDCKSKLEGNCGCPLT